MKRILILTNSFIPRKSGLGNYVFVLSKILKEKGHNVIVICYDTEKTKKYFENIDEVLTYRIKCFSILGYYFPNILHLIKIIKNLKKEKTDFLITNTRFFNLSLIGGLYSIFTKSVWIHIEHGATFVSSNNPFIWVGSRIYDLSIGRWIFNKANKLVCVSEQSKKFVKSFTKKRIKIIHFPFKLRTSKRKIKKRWDIIFVGRLVYGKGVQDLIKAMKFITKKNKDTKLIIVGDGDYRNKLEKLSKNLNLEKNIFFAGEKNKGEVYDLLSSSRVFINTSYSEGLGATIIEAGLNNIPVISTSGGGGTLELIKHKKTGVLIKEKSPKNIFGAYFYIIHNKKIVKNYTINLKKHIVRKFNYKKITKEWDNMLK
jgi:glycosyltransferase involved in cell wall biosynthesis